MNLRCYVESHAAHRSANSTGRTGWEGMGYSTTDNISQFTWSGRCGYHSGERTGCDLVKPLIQQRNKVPDIDTRIVILEDSTEE